MIPTLLIHQQESHTRTLTDCLTTQFPVIHILGSFECPMLAGKSLKETAPQLIFVDQQWVQELSETLIATSDVGNVEMIAVQAYDQQATIDSEDNWRTGEVISLPVNLPDFLYTVNRVLKWLLIQKDLHAVRDLLSRVMTDQAGSRVVQIPTTDGIEFLRPVEIIRCEGIQGITRIFCKSRRSITSSYHLGIFGNMLTPLGFCSPHKSHLVNPLHIQRYKADGTLIMRDESRVPVSRRRKKEFLTKLNAPYSHSF